ncbi:MAG TPA: hypothetical protein VF223_13975 [Trebonia sp.]
MPATAAWAMPLSSPAVKRYGLVNPGFPPVAIDGLAVFTADNVISALRLTDGSQAWQRTYPGASGSGPDGVGGLWAWHGELIALTSSMEGPGPCECRRSTPRPARSAGR